MPVEPVGVDVGVQVDVNDDVDVHVEVEADVYDDVDDATTNILGLNGWLGMKQVWVTTVYKLLCSKKLLGHRPPQPLGVLWKPLFFLATEGAAITKLFQSVLFHENL